MLPLNPLLDILTPSPSVHLFHSSIRYNCTIYNNVREILICSLNTRFSLVMEEDLVDLLTILLPLILLIILNKLSRFQGDMNTEI
uniref:Uncharacterized protein n=1 Tax=Octopus bimaculoides TaxID=37653 RepID=A0A0L8FT69_OCTBM